MGDDENHCNVECTSNSVCVETSNMTCIQHPTIDKVCRCIKQGYRLTTDLVQNSAESCQG